MVYIEAGKLLLTVGLSALHSFFKPNLKSGI